MTAEEYGKDWPFKASTAELSCERGPAAYATINGRKFSLNGTAKTLSKNQTPFPHEVKGTLLTEEVRDTDGTVVGTLNKSTDMLRVHAVALCE